SLYAYAPMCPCVRGTGVLGRFKKILCAYVSMRLCVSLADISGRLKPSLIRASLLCLMLPSLAWAQLPQVKLLDKTKGAPSETVAVTGFNFGTDLTKVK